VFCIICTSMHLYTVCAGPYMNLKLRNSIIRSHILHDFWHNIEIKKLLRLLFKTSSRKCISMPFYSALFHVVCLGFEPVPKKLETCFSRNHSKESHLKKVFQQNKAPQCFEHGTLGRSLSLYRPYPSLRTCSVIIPPRRAKRPLCWNVWWLLLFKLSLVCPNAFQPSYPLYSYINATWNFRVNLFHLLPGPFNAKKKKKERKKE
jgi:hypothetical protein